MKYLEINAIILINQNHLKFADASANFRKSLKYKGKISGSVINIAHYLFFSEVIYIKIKIKDITVKGIKRIDKDIRGMENLKIKYLK